MECSELLFKCGAGSIGAAQNLEELRSAGITHILNASPLAPCFFRDCFKYLVIEVHDDPAENIAQYFSCANQFIEEVCQPVPQPSSSSVS